jgi:predicted lipoprotein with Yx(FWY)xxD motif
MKQWALNGMSLYFFTPDMTADDTNGENKNTVWHLARPAPVKVDEHATEGKLLVAHGDVLDSVGKTAAQLTGLTLYTFDSDVKDSGNSQCFDGCATNWPPLYATSMDQAFGDFSVISRSENSTTTYQWAYQGLPLYFYKTDTQVGDTFGDYTSWTIARP